MYHTRWIKIGVLFICGLLLLSCSQLPDYAQPRFHTNYDQVNTESTGFRYRDLTVEDFKAKSLSPEYQQYQNDINARSCLTVRPSDKTRATITAVHYHEQTFYVGTLMNIEFEAFFIPSCSWWNPDTSPEKRSYVLQHEQIHFALSELTARKVTHELQIKMQEYTALGGTPSEVKLELKTVLLKSAHELIRSELSIHSDFDEDTSLFFDPEEQNEWFQKIADQLNSKHLPNGYL